MPRESDIESRQVIDKSERYDYWGYRKITDLVHQDGIRIGREKVRLTGRREGLRVSVESPKRRRRSISSRGKYLTRGIQAMSGAVISHLSERKIARR